MNILRTGNEVESNFSRHADLYDKYAGLQNLAARELIDRCRPESVSSILDLGCGTGNYTLLLRQKFSTAHIKAIDISRAMVDVACRKCADTGIEFMVADAEKFDPTVKFDLITSNATFQWFEDLGSSLGRYKEALTEEGSLLFSAFGPVTFCELGASVEEVLGKNARIASESFTGKEALTGMMEDNFARSGIKEAVIKKRYASLTELLRHIKYTGARGGGISDIPFWTRNMLNRIEEAYIAKFGCIEASYQIFYCKGSE